MAISKRYMKLPSGMVAYVKAGDAGDPVVFIHGIPTSSFLWRGVIAGLQGGFSCYALDMLGYGDSDQSDAADFSLPGQADVLDAWAAAAGVASFHLVGHDIGGGVAQIYATRHPERVRSMVLVDTVAYDSWPVEDVARLKDPRWDDILRAQDLRPGFRRALEQGLVHHQERLTDEVLEGYVGPFSGRAGRQAYLRCARALDNRHLTDLTAEIEALQHRTLVLWGEHDPFQDIQYGRRLVAALANATLEVCPDGSHFLPEDVPDWVAGRVRAFLAAA